MNKTNPHEICLSLRLKFSLRLRLGQRERGLCVEYAGQHEMEHSCGDMINVPSVKDTDNTSEGASLPCCLAGRGGGGHEQREETRVNSSSSIGTKKRREERRRFGVLQGYHCVCTYVRTYVDGRMDVRTDGRT